VSAYGALLDLVRAAFTEPGFALFGTLVRGWVCAPGRRTITRVLAVGDPEGQHAHDAYHRLVREGRWSMRPLWRALATHLVRRFCPATGAVSLDLDDTLFHKSGRKILLALVLSREVAGRHPGLAQCSQTEKLFGTCLGDISSQIGAAGVQLHQWASLLTPSG